MCCISSISLRVMSRRLKGSWNIPSFLVLQQGEWPIREGSTVTGYLFHALGILRVRIVLDEVYEKGRETSVFLVCKRT